MRYHANPPADDSPPEGQFLTFDHQSDSRRGRLRRQVLELAFRYAIKNPFPAISDSGFQRFKGFIFPLGNELTESNQLGCRGTGPAQLDRDTGGRNEETTRVVTGVDIDSHSSGAFRASPPKNLGLAAYCYVRTAVRASQAEELIRCTDMAH